MGAPSKRMRKLEICEYSLLESSFFIFSPCSFLPLSGVIRIGLLYLGYYGRLGIKVDIFGTKSVEQAATLNAQGRTPLGVIHF